MKRTLFALLLAASVAAVAQAPKPAPAPAKPAAPAPAAAPAKAAPAAAIVGNKDSKTFHKADCKTAAKMKEANKTTFASAAEADKAGYKACKVCKP
ncbi:MAG: cell envelope biogenesis protein TolA [Holophagaceae bacterium]|nr:cell envelope biogenesis protein TolA [Holophagaceae bacterium]